MVSANFRLYRTTVVMLAVCAACDRQPSEPEAITLEGSLISDADFLSRPRKLLVSGERLLVTDNYAPYLHVLEIPGGRHLASVGGSGGGPGEFQSVSDIQEDPSHDGSFWLYDVELGRMTRMGIAAGTEEPRLLQTHNLEFPTGSMYLQPILLDDTSMVATGIFPEGRLVRARRTGAFVGTIGTTPADPSGRAVPIQVLQHAYAGPLERRPDGSRVAVATRQADLIEFYHADGRLIRKARGASGFEPVYEVNRRQGAVSMGTGEDLRFGYIDLTATDEFVFALFSGDRRGDFPGRANFGKTVHVFDWNGTRLATFNLPDRALSIAVAPEGTHLYAVHWEPKPAIHRYALPHLRQ